MQKEVRCPTCHMTYRVDEATVVRQGGWVVCDSCGERWQAFAPKGAAAAGEAEPVTCPGCGLRFVPGAAAAQPGNVSTAMAAQRAAAPVRSGQKTILIVEDVAYFTALARDTLGAKYRAITVDNVADARKILTREHIDLLVLDLTLREGEDGVDLLRSLGSKEFPVLIFTSGDEAEMYGEAWKELQALGADDLLIKGMNVEESLLKKVGSLLGGKQ